MAVSDGASDGRRQMNDQQFVIPMGSGLTKQ
jgi:hypothetical protein